MKKKLLPAMIGAVLAAGVSGAGADATIFGHIDASYIGVDQDGGQDDTVFRCTTCSIGFKGSEDLGNGLKAIFSIDFEYDIFNRRGNSLSATIPTFTTTTSGAIVTGTGVTKISVATDNSIVDRDQWVGLAGGFGQVRLGTISTGYKSHGAMIDPLYRTALQGRDRGLQSRLHSGAGEELQGRATNTVRWDSVDYSGVKLVAHYTLDSNEGDGEDDNPYGIGASYENGGLLAFADYMNNARSGAGEKDAWKIGGKYDMGMFGVMAQYEDYSNSSTDDETVWQVAGTATLFGITGYLGFGKGEDDTSGNEYTAWTLAAMYNFSKNTMVYVGHSQVDCDAGGSLAACATVSAGGGEDDQTAIGLKHKF